MVEFSNGDKSLLVVISPEDIPLSDENIPRSLLDKSSLIVSWTIKILTPLNL